MIWRDVIGYEGFYEISDAGHVRRNGRLLSMHAGPGGHPRVFLYRDGIRQHAYVHTLVLSAFVGPRPDKHEACHRDGNPRNNSLENLRWGTRSENVLDSVEHRTHNWARRNDCMRGHELAEWNLVESSARRGKRACKACAREYANARAAGRQFNIQAASRTFESLRQAAMD